MMLVAMVGLLASSAQAAAVLTIDPTTPLPDDTNRLSISEWNSGHGDSWSISADIDDYGNTAETFWVTAVEDTIANPSTDPYIQRYANLPTIDTATYKYVEFKLKIPTGASDVIQFCYRIAAGNHYFRDMTTGYDDGQFHVYQFDVSADANWTTTITKLRLDLGGINSAEKTFEFDYFRLSSVPEPVTMTLLLIGLPFALRRRRR